jgi:hypothetical protein
LEDEDVDEDDNEDADDLEGEEENEVLLRAWNYIFFLIIYSFLFVNFFAVLGLKDAHQFMINKR